MQNEIKERIINTYFQMWVNRDFSDINAIFDESVFYRECYGACYRNIDEINLWVEKQMKKQIVQSWNINNFYFVNDYAFVTWTFRAIEKEEYVFDGLSQIKFTQEQKIIEITEYETKHTVFYPFESE